MIKKMSIFGIGPLWTLISTIYAVLIIRIHYFYFPFEFIIFLKQINMILGIILIVMGVFIWIYSLIYLKKHFKKEQLCTTGFNKYVRHPIYASWILLTVPGIILLWDSVLGITIPFFMYLIFRILISKEENYLSEKFGKKYTEYKIKTGNIFPYINF
ncbi:MAG: isoprenylcysteine carboxylmethyltransferase family protein [Candidatus Woesearchaeota archaeon]